MPGMRSKRNRCIWGGSIRKKQEQTIALWLGEAWKFTAGGKNVWEKTRCVKMGVRAC
jgi:squalene cyclase